MNMNMNYTKYKQLYCVRQAINKPKVNGVYMHANNASEITEAFVCVEIKSHTDDTFTVHSKSVYISWNEEESKRK